MLALKDEEILAKQVHKDPCLYNRKNESYDERDVVRNAWEKVAEHLTFLENGTHDLF